MNNCRSLHITIKLVILILLVFPFAVYSQLDAPLKSIRIEGIQKNKVEQPKFLSLEKSSGLLSSGTLTLKSKMNLSEPLSSNKKKEIRFNEGNTFAQKDYTALEKKLNQHFSKADVALKPEFYKDQFLGDFKSGSKFVNFLYRDHEYVDGDRVSVSINDVVVHPNIYLQGDFQGFSFDLEKGFNKIDIVALNQGSSGPNTAQFVMYDDTKSVISSNIWNLATGVKATVIIIKD